MSMTVCVPVDVPLYAQVIAALARLSSWQFSQWERTDPKNVDIESEAFRCWMALRETLQLITVRRALELKLHEKERLKEALLECPPGPDVDFVFEQRWNERS